MQLLQSPHQASTSNIAFRMSGEGMTLSTAPHGLYGNPFKAVLMSLNCEQPARSSAELTCSPCTSTHLNRA